ncbi:MAG: hypothetical protein KDD56_08835, partial [Bdellovibrionales bacterium]|nr:hypothetical protein [Bdellovibrionales bacterium]
LLRLKLLFRKNVQTYASIRLSKIDHYELILAAHHEFASLFLNFIFPESIEKGLVKLVRNPV